MSTIRNRTCGWAMVPAMAVVMIGGLSDWCRAIDVLLVPTASSGSFTTNVTNPLDTEVTISPGDTVRIDVRVSNWAAGGELLRAVQVEMMTSSLTSAPSGSLAPTDIDVANDGTCDFASPLCPLCGSPANVVGVFVDACRKRCNNAAGSPCNPSNPGTCPGEGGIVACLMGFPDFFGQMPPLNGNGVGATSTAALVVLWTGLSGGVGVADDGFSHDAGTYVFTASADASGTFTLTLWPSPCVGCSQTGTFVRNQDGQALAQPTNLGVMRVHIRTGSCCVGLTCTPDQTVTECTLLGGEFREGIDCSVGCECVSNADCNDRVACTNNICVAGVCIFPPVHALCDDGLYCNGAEFCDALLGCQPGTDPCAGERCQEGTDTCGPPPVCGDGITAPPEECDDGGTTWGDGCGPTCRLEFCGDALINQPGELCDDGNGAGGDGCGPTCAIEFCGDGIANNNGEDCDPPDGLHCDASCQWICGDGVLQSGEACDDGNLLPGDFCDGACRIEPGCGNGVHESGEGCDDGDQRPGDGCDANCLLECTCDPLRADVNNDGFVNLSDILCLVETLAGNLGSPACFDGGAGGSVPLSALDVNCDNVVDYCDAGLVYLVFFALPDPCAASCSACCRPGHPCVATTQLFCEGFVLQGTYQGDGVACNAADCDCNQNGLPDRCDLSCAGPGCNLPGCGGSADCNNNDLPDDCEQGACCLNPTTCVNADAATCAAANGQFLGPCIPCPSQNAAVIIEPGGDVFVHIVGPPVDCPQPGGASAEGCTGTGPYLDAWMSPANGSLCHNFGVPASPVIPADFFGPGSDPFSGSVCLKGSPLGLGQFGDSDTLISRTADPFDRCSLPSPTPVAVDLQVTALSLASVSPITVTFNAGTSSTQWDVAVDLSAMPQTLGTLTATKTHCNGGTYTSTLPVLPRFTFTKVGDPGMVHELDTGVEGLTPVVLNQTTPSPWVHDLSPGLSVSGDPCTTFHPGIQELQPTTACDCNANSIRDKCEIEAQPSRDVDGDGRLDSCDCLRAYGDVNDDGFVNLEDTLCELDTFASIPSPVSCLGVLLPSIDLAPCPEPDGFINADDVLAVLDSFGGNPACGCSP